MASLLEQLEASIEREKRRRGMTTDYQLDTISGKVAELAYGRDGRPIKCMLEGRDGGWLNFSKPEYRGHFEEPGQGDNVKLGVSRSKDNTLWVKTCEIQKRGNGAQSTYDDGQVPAGGRDLSIMRQTCLKASTELVTAWVGRLSAEIVFDRKAISGNVLDLAEDFERWLVRSEVPFE